MFNIRIGDYVRVIGLEGRKRYRKSWEGIIADTKKEFFILQTKHYKICFNYVDVLIDDIRVITLRRNMDVNKQYTQRQRGRTRVG